MENMDQLTAVRYITENNPLCDNCARSNLEEIRIAAGLYGLIMEIISGSDISYTKQFLDQKITRATSF